ncbi:MAG: hypothetical protein HFG61_00980 [Lachnospiraceae bacterium]|nr:hypothetical protein [Lachnospiraceae bacterium]
MSGLNLSGCEAHIISLVCSRDALQKRLQKDVDAGIRTVDAIARRLGRIPLYENRKTDRVDVSLLSASQAAQRILEIRGERRGGRK